MKSIVKEIKKKALEMKPDASLEIKSPFSNISSAQMMMYDDTYCTCPDPICVKCGKRVKVGFKDYMFVGKTKNV